MGDIHCSLMWRHTASQWLRAKQNSRDSSMKEKQAHSAVAPVYNRSKICTALTVRLANIKAKNRGKNLLQLVQLHKYTGIFSERL